MCWKKILNGCSGRGFVFETSSSVVSTRPTRVVHRTTVRYDGQPPSINSNTFQTCCVFILFQKEKNTQVSCVSDGTAHMYAQLSSMSETDSGSTFHKPKKKLMIASATRDGIRDRATGWVVCGGLVVARHPRGDLDGVWCQQTPKRACFSIHE